MKWVKNNHSKRSNSRMALRKLMALDAPLKIVSALQRHACSYQVRETAVQL